MSSNRPPGTLARKAYAGFFWQVLGFSLNTILSVAHLAIMARLLSPEIFGQFAIATIIVALTSIVAEFGLGPALVQKKNVSPEDISFVFLFNMITAMSLLTLLFILSDNISNAFDGAISPLMIKVLSLNLLLQSVGLASKALLLRDMNFHKIFVATNLSYFIGMILIGVTLASLGYGIWSLIIGFIATSFVSSLYFLLVSPISFSFNFNRQDSAYLFKYGVGLTTVQGVNQFSLLADKLILTQLVSTAFLGLYERSQRLQQMPGVFIGGVLDTVMFSTLSKFSQDKTKLGEHFFNFVTVALLVGVYISVFVFTFAEPIVTIALGNRWLEAVGILQLLSALIGFQLLSRLSDIYVRATGSFKKSIRVKLIYLVIVFAFALIGYQLKHIQGALVGLILASAAHAILMLRVCQQDSGYSLLDLWNRVKPSVILAALLIIKNLIIMQLLPDSLWVSAGLIILSDVVVIVFLLSSNRLIGAQNREYVFARLNELKHLGKSKLSNSE